MAIVTTYGLKDFVADLDGILDRHGDPRLIVGAAKPLFRRLVSDTRWLDEKYTKPVEGRSVQYLLHKDPQERFSVVSVVWWPGYATPIHDHLVWGLVGLYEGLEEETRFLRVDAGERPGFAQIQEVSAAITKPGNVSQLVPPDEDIHRIRNVSPVPSRSIHIYGADINEKIRNWYDEQTGEMHTFRTRYVIVC